MRKAVEGARRVVLTTHVHADGDGAGSEAALASFLLRRGAEPAIVNPTPFPTSYAFLLEGLEAVPVHAVADPAGKEALERAELLVVLDTSEASRLGEVAARAEGGPTVVIDHHPPNPDPLGEPAVREPAACATGELVYDLLAVSGHDLAPEEARGLYVAIATDTGSFRFSNTSPRAHRIAARLLEAGVDPAAMYRRLYGQLTPAALALLHAALSTLETDPEVPVAWISLTRQAVEAAGADRDDMEGIVEYPRRLKGVEVAVLFRELPGGRTKVSLRSNGAVDVAAVARSLGGGGHEKAAGALLEAPLERAREAVLEPLRRAVRAMSGAG